VSGRFWPISALGEGRFTTQSRLSRWAESGQLWTLQIVSTVGTTHSEADQIKVVCIAKEMIFAVGKHHR
jgi:hypothetical protein